MLVRTFVGVRAHTRKQERENEREGGGEGIGKEERNRLYRGVLMDRLVRSSSIKDVLEGEFL